MAINVKFAELGMTKPLEIKGTVKNLKKTYQMQLDMANSEETMEALEGTQALQAVLDLQNSVEAYLIDILRLSAKQIEKLEDLEQEKLMEITQYTAMRVMGMSDADIKDVLAQSAVEDEGLDQAPEKE